MEEEIRLKRTEVFIGNSEELWGAHPFRQFLTKSELKYFLSGELDINIVLDNRSDSEVSLIPIEEMKELIGKAEKAGANFIEIDYHPDHQEYMIYGSLITRMTKEEEEKQMKINSISEKLKISAKIRNLENQISELRTKL